MAFPDMMAQTPFLPPCLGVQVHRGFSLNSDAVAGLQQKCVSWPDDAGAWGMVTRGPVRRLTHPETLIL